MLKYQKIKTNLTNDILKMAPGETLPTRKQLSDQYHSARATIDKAISELTKEGLLISKPGSGTRVSIIPKNNQVQNWGIVVPDITEEIYSGIVRGAEDYAEKIKANIILCNSDNNLLKQDMYLRRLQDSRVSGIILVPVIYSDGQEVNYKFYDELIRSKIPIVFCNRSMDGIDVPLIASNDFYGAYIATKHLLRQGYKKPAYLAREKYKTSIDRCQGFLSALLEKNIPINRDAILIKLSKEKSREKIKQLLSSDSVDSIFCFDDILAKECYEVAAELDINIPSDLGIIGYNNTSVCETLNPPLSSVSFKNVEIGSKAAEILFKLIKTGKHSEFETYLFQPTVEVRGSTSKGN